MAIFRLSVDGTWADYGPIYSSPPFTSGHNYPQMDRQTDRQDNNIKQKPSSGGWYDVLILVIIPSNDDH